VVILQQPVAAMRQAVHFPLVRRNIIRKIEGDR
jgi:hypothetical protein